MFWLEEAGLPMTGANIARAMQLSPPTVHEMIGRLVDDGYVERKPDKSLDFTESGREHASHIVRRHRMIERFLTDVLGIPWDEVHEEAERIEHAMSPVLEERMRAAIGDATTCPHGHPIVEGAREQGSLLADVEVGADVVVLRFENEAEELLHYLKDAGPRPGPGGQASRAPTRRASRSPPPTAATRSPAASPRPSRSAPTRRRRRARRSPSSWSSPATATAAETAGAARLLRTSRTLTIGVARSAASLPPRGSAVTITVFDAVHVVDRRRRACRRGRGRRAPSPVRPRRRAAPRPRRTLSRGSCVHVGEVQRRRCRPRCTIFAVTAGRVAGDDRGRARPPPEPPPPIA